MSGEKRPGEFELIERYFAPLAGEGTFGLKDDAALLSVTPGKALVVTQDAIAEPIHFLPGNPPDTIAKKALRVNLSDLAAKGAVPTGFSLALGLGEDWRTEWLEGFARGLAEDCRKFGLVLSGGDTFRTGNAPVIAITAWGEIDAAHYRSRLDAKPGDRLFVTGTIGNGALGLLAHTGKLTTRGEEGRRPDRDGKKQATISEATRRALEQLYFVPDPPVVFAPLIAEFASASMDISDGFVGDLQKLAAASNVDFEIGVDAVPFSPQVRLLIDAPENLETALTGGDDYQLLFTVPESRVASFRQKAQKAAVAVTELAVATESSGPKGSGNVTILDREGQRMRFGRASWRHF